MSTQPGQVISDRYHLIDRIAVGGMGEVWRAMDTRLDREVAIKLLKAEYGDDQTFLARFRGEARHAANLGHPNIAGVFDYSEANEQPYLVMELVRGEPLNAMVPLGAMSVRQAMPLLAQTARGLAAAHAAGVIHRDIKPGNIMVTEQGGVKITDFGIARAADSVPLTQTGQVMGTAQYLAPEQASGRPVTPSSDLYSLGVVGYELLAGVRPFDDESMVAIAMSHVNEPAPILGPDVPVGARALIASALSKDPSHRPANAEEFALAAEAAARGDVAGVFSHLPQQFVSSLQGSENFTDIPQGLLDGNGVIAAGMAGATSVMPSTHTPDQTQVMSAGQTQAMPAGQTQAMSASADPGYYVPQYQGNSPAAGYGPNAGYDSYSDQQGYDPRRQGNDYYEPEPRSGMSPWVIGTVAGLLFIIAGALIILAMNRDKNGTENTSASPTTSIAETTTQAPTTTTSTTTTSAAPQGTEFESKDFVGKQVNDVVTSLKQLGYNDVKRSPDKTSRKEAGTVLDVSPEGKVEYDQEIVVTYADSKPSSTKTQTPTNTETGKPTSTKKPTSTTKPTSEETSEPGFEIGDLFGKGDT